MNKQFREERAAMFAAYEAWKRDNILYGPGDAWAIAWEAACAYKNEQTKEELIRYKRALRIIRAHYGKVCYEYALCSHPACESSVGAWVEADKALNPSRYKKTEEK